MKKLLFFAVWMLLASSCVTIKRTQIIPTAISTVNTATFSELNLNRKDYEVLNTLTAEAIINRTSNKKGTEIEIVEQNGEFTLKYTQDKFGSWTCVHSGIAKLGYLSSDYDYKEDELVYAENVARRLAIYRLINFAQENGADGIIEPTVSIVVDQVGSTVIYKASVAAKIIKLKTDN